MFWSDDLGKRLKSVLHQLQELDEEEARWRSRMDVAGDAERAQLISESFSARRDERRRPLKSELAHLMVLASLIEYEYGDATYPKGAEPAFAISLDQLLDRLREWLDRLVAAHPFGLYVADCQRLTLGWCAQLLASQAAHSSNPAFPEDFLEAARSIYAFSLDPRIAYAQSPTGRRSPNDHLMLAYASFPFLEGFARRGLPKYVKSDGTVLTDFQVSGTRYGRRGAKRINNIAHTLQLLEDVHSADSLGNTLATTRTLAGMHESPTGKGPVGLFELIADHRNLNLHAGGHLPQVGLAALILAAMIGLEVIRDEFSELSEISRMVCRDQSPLNSNTLWPHWIFYPVDFANPFDPINIHRWHL